ncbi:hypothetical protein SAMN02745883_01477 [Caminicella sporogenes DSM 14501]|uniref:DUF218 domain-containing protein n=1 Tax=Caminicella sporogenes DSM 14501 TaxID=1121266 RepID=A0A1M6QF67_9FIRM|nr:hypothetical protein [Caminicella sporogenes]SHK18902.1 hypothetical protein SAMN02745883_01477 [Caminicella sporogenes DSM 14501]
MKNILKKIVIILLFLFIMSFIIIEGLIINEGRLDDDINSENIDYIIILGARLYGSTPSPALYERLNKAYEYAVKNKKLKIVVTGVDKGKMKMFQKLKQ